MTHELYKKYRPTTLDQVVGQVSAVKILKEKLASNFPHTVIFSGPSGTGKTTLARILKTQLNCSDRDFTELNCASFRGIDTVREITQNMVLCPIGGKCRIWLIDEAHAVSRDGQGAFLKTLEDTPSHCYFFLATTDPNKLLQTIRTRATEIALKSISTKDLSSLISSVAKKEKLKLSEEVVERIIEISDGSARKALVILDQIKDIKDEESQLEAVYRSDSKTLGIDLARALMNGKSKWTDIAAILRNIEDDPEGIRRLVLGYCSAVMLKGKGPIQRAYEIMIRFEDNLFDCGKAGLVRACYEILNLK